MRLKNSTVLPGKILLIGPSRAGKSYLASAFRGMGLNVIDTDRETNLIAWRNDKTGQPITSKPAKPSPHWFATHHFMMDKQALAEFLAGQSDVLMFAHSWNIMECIAMFDEVYMMYVPAKLLMERMKLLRPDHEWQGSPAEVNFMMERHQERQAQARELGIPFIDVSGDANTSLKAIVRLHKAATGA